MSIICEICMEEYQNSFHSEKTPRILECGDTFCTECLKKIKEKNNTIICPVCRAESSEEIEKIRVNKFVINQVEKKILSAVRYLDLDNEEINMNKIDFKFSIALLGESGVGKTCIGNFYQTGKAFQVSPIATVAIDHSYKYLSIHSKTVLITLWDTAGQEKYKSLATGYIRGVDAIIIVFSLINFDNKIEYEKYKTKSEEEKNKIKEDYKIKTFGEIEYWIKHCRQINVQKNQIIYLVGNKAEKKEYRLIDAEDAQNYANANKIKYYETSAKTGEKINEMFNSLALDLIKIYSNGDILDDSMSRKTNSTLSTKKFAKKKRKDGGCSC